MAEKNLVDEAYVNNPHEQRFTVADGDAGGPYPLTGLIVKWAMTPIDPSTGAFNPAVVTLEKNSGIGGEMTLIDGPNGIIDVNIDPADTAALAAIDYHFQLEVFDGGGANGVVTAEGTLTLLPNLVEVT
jgi:hypothetical protein